VEHKNKSNQKPLLKPKQAFQILTHKREIYKYVLAGWLISTFLLSAIIVFQFIGFKSALAAKENQLFVVHDQKVYEAQKDESFSRSEIEKDNFVRTWLSNGFAYDKHTYQTRINMALEWMAANDADAFFRGSQQSKTQNQLNNYNANTAVVVDSLKIIQTSKLSQVNVVFNWDAYLNGELNTSTKYKLISDIKPVRRTRNNPFGLLLINTQYRKIETKK